VLKGLIAELKRNIQSQGPVPVAFDNTISVAGNTCRF
jgi:hypothetical protein